MISYIIYDIIYDIIPHTNSQYLTQTHSPHSQLPCQRKQNHDIIYDIIYVITKLNILYDIIYDMIKSYMISYKI